MTETWQGACNFLKDSGFVLPSSYAGSGIIPCASRLAPRNQAALRSPTDERPFHLPLGSEGIDQVLEECTSDAAVPVAAPLDEKCAANAPDFPCLSLRSVVSLKAAMAAVEAEVVVRGKSKRNAGKNQRPLDKAVCHLRSCLFRRVDRQSRHKQAKSGPLSLHHL